MAPSLYQNALAVANRKSDRGQQQKFNSQPYKAISEVRDVFTLCGNASLAASEWAFGTWSICLVTLTPVFRAADL